MNREIKFRAKCAFTDSWVYGNLINFGENVVPEIVGFDIYHEGHNVYREVEVDIFTIGQFTGLSDKNGKEIYEGDIVRWERDHKLYVVKFQSGMFYASVEELNEGVYGGFPLWTLCIKEQHCEIVGNIHEKDRR